MFPFSSSLSRPFDLSAVDSSKEAAEEQLQRVADFLRQRRLETPAAWLLEIHLPISNVLYHGWLFTLPVLAPLIGKQPADDLAVLLSERENIARLIELLQARH